MLIYLASPYSHPSAAVREERHSLVCQLASQMMQSGLMVFSPISHSHAIASHGELPLGWEYWQEFDRSILGICDALYVAQIDGWEESHGIRAEMAIAEELGIPILYIAAPVANGSTVVVPTA